jgi:succinate dehydrogenase hydrophobic anchor subunit
MRRSATFYETDSPIRLLLLLLFFVEFMSTKKFLQYIVLFVDISGALSHKAHKIFILLYKIKETLHAVACVKKLKEQQLRVTILK